MYVRIYVHCTYLRRSLESWGERRQVQGVRIVQLAGLHLCLFVGGCSLTLKYACMCACMLPETLHLSTLSLTVCVHTKAGWPTATVKVVVIEL